MRADQLTQRRGFRVLGLDDGPFMKDQAAPVLVVGPILRGNGQFDGLLSTQVERDGFDATGRLIDLITGSRFLPQLHYVLLGGITLGGFNVVDLPALAAGTGLKVLAVTRRAPDLPRMLAATACLPEPDRRAELIRRAGPIRRFSRLYGQLHGLDPTEAQLLLDLLCINGHFPEPLRVAHLIAGGLVRGESGHRA